jgi:type I restriction enzyme S subunit
MLPGAHLLHWQKVVEGFIITGATVDRIPLEKFPDFPVTLPSLSVQKKICDILSSYDDLIENNLRRMALLEESARLLYREWFIRLRFPGHEHARIINGAPEGWGRKQLRDVIELNYGKVLKETGRTEGPYLRQLPKEFTNVSPIFYSPLTRRS